MKDKELKLEEIEIFHTLGGACYSVVKCTMVNRSYRSHHMGEGSLHNKPVNLCVCESKERRHDGECAGVCVTRLSDVR